MAGPVRTPSWFDGRMAIAMLLTMRASLAFEGVEVWPLSAAFVVSLSLPLFVQGRASGVASLWHSAGQRARRIEQIRAAWDTSIARLRSSALIQRSRGEGVPSPVCVALCRVMGGIITQIFRPTVPEREDSSFCEKC